jgi:hypothetical protein
MRCPKCGNEISQDEVFCGQCGAPTTNLPPTQSAESLNTQAPRSGLLSSYNTRPSSPYYPGTMPAPPNSYGGGTPPPQPNRPPTAGQLQPPLRQPGPQQPTDFYQDATEAISVLPSNNQVYPQQGFAGTPMPGPGMYPGAGTYYGSQAQPFQTGNYAGPGYPQPQMLPSGQGYGTQGNFAPPPQKQGSTILVIACVGLAISLLVVTVIGVLYLQHGQSNQASNATPQASPTSVVTPTLVPSPTPMDTPTPVPTPSPTVAPTAAPDPGFTFCDQTCTNNGFSVEYPDGWQQNTPADGSGAQFTNPSAQDQYAAFKVSDGTSATASDLVNSDLKNNFTSQSGYTPPTSSSSTTIGGVTWVYSTATYDLNGQTERVQVYATVHQTKSYIIELEAADSDFDTVNTKYFETMLGSLQFQ